MSTKSKSASFIRWRLENADRVLEYKREYHRRNYARFLESRREERHNRYVWNATAAKYRNILIG